MAVGSVLNRRAKALLLGFPAPLSHLHSSLSPQLTLLSILSCGSEVHIAGVGDYPLSGVTALPDPCPLPSAAKKKGLRDKEKLFYAPMSGLGDLLYDKDAVYININDHLVQFSKDDTANAGGTHKGNQRDVGVELVKSLQKTKYSVDEKLEKSFISLFGKRPNPSLEALIDSVGGHDVSNPDAPLEPVERYQSEMKDGDSDTEDDSSESSDGEEVPNTEFSSGVMDDSSDEEAFKASKQQSPTQSNFREQIDYHEGRVRRKAVFENEMDINDPEDYGEENEDDGTNSGDGDDGTNSGDGDGDGDTNSSDDDDDDGISFLQS